MKKDDIRRRKTLQELKNDGIITIGDVKAKGKNRSTIKHATVGDFTSLKNPKKPAGGKNGGNMDSGGHGQSNIERLEKTGVAYSIVKTYPNGVRIGGVLGHKEHGKRLGYMGQSWFPETWTDDDILVAGTHVVNSVDIKPGVKVFSEYNGVRIGVIFDDNGNPSTIFPDAVEQP